MNKIVLNRLREICPVKRIADMTSDEIKHDCHIAFEIIGYNPVDLEVAYDKAFDCSKATMLGDFVYDVWRCDK